MNKEVLYEMENGIVLVTLNRPERRNAMNQALLSKLYTSIEFAGKDNGARAIIITGNGKSFCSGLDIAILSKEDLFDPRGDGSDLREIFKACRKPIIGAINGHAITGGFELALNCDFLIGSENAAFADTHGKMGIHPGWGMSQMLQHAVGQRMAKQISFTSNFINAQDALRCGLLNEVVSADRLIPRAKEIAAQIAEIDPGKITMMKNLIEYQNKVPLEDSIVHERKEMVRWYKTTCN